MTFAAEQIFRAAVLTAESVRQQSKAAARVTYAYDPANYAAYVIAIADADVAYITSVNTANGTMDEPTGGNGFNGPIAGAGWTPLLAIA